MSLSEVTTDLIGRVLLLEGTESITDYKLSWAAAWARSAPAWLFFGCALLTIAAVVFYAKYQRQKHAGARVVLTIFRAAALCLLLVMLAEPVLNVTVSSERRPLVQVLLDGTASMEIIDQYDDDYRARLVSAVDLGGAVGLGDPAEDTPESPSGGGNADPRQATRADYVRALFQKSDGNLLAGLSEKAEVQLFTFDSSQGVRSLQTSANGGEIDGKYVADQVTTKGNVSALGAALEDLSRRHATSNLAALVILSDFGHNQGKDPVAAAGKLGTKIYTVGIGAATAVDVAVTLHPPPIMKKDEQSTVTVTVRQTGLDDRSASERSVKVILTGRRIDNLEGREPVAFPIAEKTVMLSGPTTSVEFVYVPEQAGRFALDVEVQPVAAEALQENNRASREVTVRDDYLRLLYIEYEPTWEWRFVKEVFHRDKLVGEKGFRTYLRYSDARVRKNDEMFLESMISSRKEFFANDVIFLGDMPASVLSDRFCEMVKEFVLKFGGGLVIVSGPQYGPAELAKTPLVDLLPVVIDPGLAAGLQSGGARRGLALDPTAPRQFRSGFSDAGSFSLRLTPQARAYDFMRLGAADNEQENELAWENLGRLPWYQRVDGLHPQATALAVHPRDLCIRDTSAGLGEPGALGDGAAASHQPLIAIRPFNPGEVIYLGFNETWRMRRKYGERYYREFWGQMIHRLALSHALGSQKRFVLRTDRQKYQANDQVLLTVEAYDEDFQPLTEEKLRSLLEAASPGSLPSGGDWNNPPPNGRGGTDGPGLSVRANPRLQGELILPRQAARGGSNTAADNVQPLILTPVRTGLFEAQFPVYADGEHYVRVIDPVTGDPVEVTFKVTDVALERQSAVRDEGLQERIAAASPGGMSLDLADVGMLVDHISLTSKIETKPRVIPLWHTWLCFGLVVALLLGEWLLRKWVNLR